MQATVSPSDYFIQQPNDLLCGMYACQTIAHFLVGKARSKEISPASLEQIAHAGIDKVEGRRFQMHSVETLMHQLNLLGIYACYLQASNTETHLFTHNAWCPAILCNQNMAHWVAYLRIPVSTNTYQWYLYDGMRPSPQKRIDVAANSGASRLVEPTNTYIAAISPNNVVRGMTSFHTFLNDETYHVFLIKNAFGCAHKKHDIPRLQNFLTRGFSRYVHVDTFRAGKDSEHITLKWSLQKKSDFITFHRKGSNHFVMLGDTTMRLFEASDLVEMYSWAGVSFGAHEQSDILVFKERGKAPFEPLASGVAQHDITIRENRKRAFAQLLSEI